MKMNYMDKIKEYKLIIIWLIILPFIPIFLKFDWLLLFPFIHIKNKKKFCYLLILSIFLLPDIRVIYYMNQFNGLTTYFYVNTIALPTINYSENFYREYLGDEYDFDKYKDEDLNILNFKCNYIKDNCLFINKNSQVLAQFSSYMAMNRFKGKFNLSDGNKREKYRVNKYITEKRIFNKVVFIPLSKEDLIIYDYSWFKNYALEGLESNENECKLLMYGSQNGWKEYTNKLINKLENDKDNKCIEKISKFYEENDLQKEKNKKEILKFLKDLKQ